MFSCTCSAFQTDNKRKWGVKSFNFCFECPLSFILAAYVSTSTSDGLTLGETKMRRNIFWLECPLAFVSAPSVPASLSWQTWKAQHRHLPCCFRCNFMQHHQTRVCQHTITPWTICSFPHSAKVQLLILRVIYCCFSLVFYCCSSLLSATECSEKSPFIIFHLKCFFF